MPQITDYTSLGKAITDFAHRADVAVYQDYFIQGALEAIQQDVFALDFGNGVRFQEAAYGPFAISGGTTPVPTDFLSPKSFQVIGIGMTSPLSFKAATWIYDTYPNRQSAGLPAYIARDVIAPASFTGSIAGTILTVSALNSGVLVAGMILDDTSGQILPNTTIAALNDDGTYTVNFSQTVASEAMSGGGNVFIFGPFPDSGYSVQGVYYQATGMLSVINNVNWLITHVPWLLHAACMVEVGKFLRNQATIDQWTAVYQARLPSLVEADKAERWAASTMAIEAA